MLSKSSKIFIFCFVFCALICESFALEDVEIEIETEQPKINFSEDELNLSYEVAEKLASNPLGTDHVQVFWKHKCFGNISQLETRPLIG